MSKNNKKEPTALKKINKEAIELWGNIYTSTKDLADYTRKYCQMVAEVYEVPPSGVISMGSQPYLNKDARLYLLNSFVAEKKIPALKDSKIQYFQVSLQPDQSAVCKVTLTFADDSVVEAVGEASRSNVKLEAVKNTLNMMAETRAMNRAIWKKIAGPTWERVVKNIKTLNVQDEDSDKIMEAGRTSAEEMNYEDVATKDNTDLFTKAKKGLEKNIDKMTQEEKYEMAEKIKASDIYSKEQKDILIEILNG